ncbi:stress responsive A/B barrel domain-containing protein [Trichoderma gamsii]|uniref:Stress responsive A/B barrel domain-containing protein n=1 Tax=Trichoderma gamsii TaxID=398673 RepID=A0A2P4ZGS8_9HYPO|nr:stress responsive A/B barrel domain-containing protein [Trichoderma gamsii]PON23495.1 stress responsive A/B barrel domain-containing protein [Trichoderma gamsii]
MSINHLILVAFKPDADADAVKKVCSGILALKDNCLTADTKTPYIKSITGGINSSSEGFSNGYSYGFVVEFNSAEDRDYYVKKDNAHRSLVNGALPVIQQLCIVDYTPGVFDARVATKL